MSVFQRVPLSSLELDLENARLPEEQKSQAAALYALANQQGSRLIALAKDIVNKGLDPLVNIAAIEDKVTGRYRILEGNRRVAAVMALETPTLVEGALDPKLYRTLRELSDRFHKNPIKEVECKVFDDEEELEHWVRLRHTGMNEGAGLVEWGGNEKDRYNSRHTGRSPAGQILDFVQSNGVDIQSDKLRSGIITSLTRLLGTPEVREKLGIDVVNGKVTSMYPPEELLKGFTYVVDQLRTGKTKVRDIYTADQRREFSRKIPIANLPSPSTAKSKSSAIDNTDEPVSQPAKKKPKVKRTIDDLDRKTLAPKTLMLPINVLRIQRIYGELQSMDINGCTNACAVLLRVFVELSVDAVLLREKWMTESERRSKPLALRMKAVAQELNKKGTLDPALLQAVEKMADDQKFVLSASTPTFNLYVHNAYVHPKPTDLLRSWDELQPFIERLWP